MPSFYNPSSQNRILDVLALMRPLAMRQHGKIRLGNEYDGGYVLPDLALQCDALVSIGVGPDVSFDLALAQNGAQVIQFDHTVERPPTEHPAFRFFKKGWGPRSEGEFLNLHDISAKLEGTPSHRLLKFDIEGGEFEIFQTLTAEDMYPYEIICCELHHMAKLGDETGFQQIRHLLSCLNRHHAPVHLHANNCCGFALIEGIPVPQVIELSFLRRDLDSFAGHSTDPIPGPLDSPNIPQLPELCMRPF
jgi:hypothetical protein